MTKERKKKEHDHLYLFNYIKRKKSVGYKKKRKVNTDPMYTCKMIVLKIILSCQNMSLIQVKHLEFLTIVSPIVHVVTCRWLKDRYNLMLRLKKRRIVNKINTFRNNGVDDLP